MADGSRSQRSGRAWLSIGEAARRVGVAPTTLRRWADGGEIRAFVTPGGHRRFARSSIDTLVAERRDRAPAERLGETPERIARACRRAGGPASREIPWLRDLGRTDVAPLRDRGRRLAAELLRYLEATTDAEREARLGEAAASVTEYGRFAREHGATTRETVEIFLRCSRPIVSELATVARRRGLSTDEAVELLESALTALDRLLVTTIDAHEPTPPAVAPTHSSATEVPAR